MTISTPVIEFSPGRAARTGESPGFSLVEVMVAAAISTFVLAGVLSAFLLVGRSGYAASNYSELAAQTRIGLEIFGEEARKASDIHWNSPQSVTFSVITSASATVLVTYAYDADPTSPTAGCFYRLLGDDASKQPRRVLMRNIAPDFAFQRFKLEQPTTTDNTATSDLETKQIQVTLRAALGAQTTVAASQSALSARYILRNKRVSN